MQKPPSKKPLIITIVVILIAVAGYFAYTGLPNDDAISSTETIDATASNDASIASKRVLDLLAVIKSLNIDTKIFTDPVFQSLIDHTVLIPSQNIGRPNPFSPIVGGTPTAPRATTTHKKTTPRR